MDTALPQKFPFILDRNLAKGNCTENWDLHVLWYSSPWDECKNHQQNINAIATIF